MNPELLRNLWLEASPFRLVLIAGLVVLVLAAASAAPPGLMTTGGAAMVMYWFFAVLWGTRSAALSVVGEIRERTWDGQKLSAIGPGEMMWGKLLGATSANWFGAILCLPVILGPVWIDRGLAACATYAVILVTLALFAQTVALLASLNLIRRNTGNWRLDTFLCQVAGIGAAFSYYTLWSSTAVFERSGEQMLVWWGQPFNLSAFHLVSMLAFMGWALVGCYRAMRAELRFANGPFVWLAYVAYVCLYTAGFESWISAHAGTLMPVDAGPTIRLALAALAALSSTYGMVFLEPKDPVRLRWLGEQVRAGRTGKAFMALDAWMLSYAVTLALGLALAAMLVFGHAISNHVRLSSLALPVLAVLGFLTRDVAIFVLMRSIAGAKGDFAGLGMLGILYLLMPQAAHALGVGALSAVFLPSLNYPALGVAAAWAQGLVVAAWAARGVRAKLNAP